MNREPVAVMLSSRATSREKGFLRLERHKQENQFVRGLRYDLQTGRKNGREVGREGEREREGGRKRVRKWWRN